ncbi:hypothetical protein HOY82DRAFT_538324 [Tuber indicum]|nr:hypothetical protein HOY82DRAFT_538324 [Tuber indicum]
MMRAPKIVQCVTSFPHASLSPALKLKRGLKVQLHPRFISPSGNAGETGISVDRENQRIGARNFVDRAGLNHIEVDVGNYLTASTAKSTSTVLPNKGVFIHDDGVQVGKISVDVDKLGIDLMSIPGPKVYKPKGIGACYIHCRPKVIMDLLISGGGQECGLRSVTLAHSPACASRKPYRISKEEIKATKINVKTSISVHQTISSRTQSAPLSCTMTTTYVNTITNALNSSPVIDWSAGTLKTMCYDKEDVKTSTSEANTEDSGVGIQEAKLTEVCNTKKDKIERKTRICKRATAYSKVKRDKAEDRLGIKLDLPGTLVRRMLEDKITLLGPETILKAKRTIYECLVRYIEAGGYPTMADGDLKVASINKIAALTVDPIIGLFKQETNKKLSLTRKKEITSIDSRTRGMMEFVVMDHIPFQQKKYILVVVAKKVSLGEARKQCFLSLKDMRDCNGGGTVYGFITKGDTWRMVSFDGTFKISNQMHLMFDGMAKEEEEWMAHYSILIDCFNVALSDGAKDLVKVV